MQRRTLSLAAVVFLALGSSYLPAEEGESKQTKYRKLEETLTGAKFAGRFTIVGKEKEAPPREEYIILSAKKVEEGELWLLKARVKYGDKNTVVPVPLEIQWAGDTPIITLTNLALPGLGTFSSRVVIHDGKYAGTWRHDAVSGHLFGTVERATAEELKE